MSEVEEVKRRRRSRQEIQRLVAEFGTSRLRPSEFCRMHGLTHGTLRRGLSRERISAGAQGTVKGLVAVEVADGDTAGRPKARRLLNELNTKSGLDCVAERIYCKLQLLKPSLGRAHEDLPDRR